MTTLISRLYADADAAHAVRDTLLHKRFSSYDVRVISKSGRTKTALKDKLSSEYLAPSTAKVYTDKIANGAAAIVVRATYEPLNAARIAREVLRNAGPLDLGEVEEERFVKNIPDHAPNVLKGHPLLLTRKKDPNRTNFYMADWPIPLISRRKPSHAMMIPRHGRMANFILPLLSDRKPSDKFAFPRHARMASFPIPLISRRRPFTGSLFAPHARMANFPLPLISRRKPYTGSLIGRHQRMANWPFPLLINGKTGTNALMPGAPRMANFPIPLLSDRKPVDKFAFPRHARMANFLMPLLSRRKPFTGSIIAPHARMAGFPFPLLSKRGHRFSFSRLLGLPTLTKR